MADESTFKGQVLGVSSEKEDFFEGEVSNLLGIGIGLNGNADNVYPDASTFKGLILQETGFVYKFLIDNIVQPFIIEDNGSVSIVPDRDGILEIEVTQYDGNSDLIIQILSHEILVPIHATLTDKDVSGNTLIMIQDTKSFLPTPTKLLPYDYPSLKQADIVDKFWYDIDSNPRSVEFNRFKSENPINNKYFFGMNQYSTANNVIGLTNLTTYLKSLKIIQNDNEKRIRNIFSMDSNWLLKEEYWDNTGIWENTAYFDI